MGQGWIYLLLFLYLLEEIKVTNIRTFEFGESQKWVLRAGLSKVP